MFEKVNPSHPDKVADRIAGAIVDYAYTLEKNPKVAVEVLLGHGRCLIITEASVTFNDETIFSIVYRITRESQIMIDLIMAQQDKLLSGNQKKSFRCGDNGIFKGVPTSNEEIQLSLIARSIYQQFPTDGKYILDGDKLVICQSFALIEDLKAIYPKAIINPLGYWSGGINVDSGATNRKLGSDMGQSVTGGGLHGKDLSKADVSVNIYAWLKAQEERRKIKLSCAIGDKEVDGRPYSEIVEIARNYINSLGGFEKFAEWGLV